MKGKQVKKFGRMKISYALNNEALWQKSFVLFFVVGAVVVPGGKVKEMFGTHEHDIRVLPPPR
jgi:hypothetical protein